MGNIENRVQLKTNFNNKYKIFHVNVSPLSYSSIAPLFWFHHQLHPAWPERGQLEFRDVVLSYRDGLPNALDGVSFVVRPGEKVGIVGRTGSGKSTLFLALFRMVELNQGQILLDELDISTVGLTQLR